MNYYSVQSPRRRVTLVVGRIGQIVLFRSSGLDSELGWGLVREGVASLFSTVSTSRRLSRSLGRSTGEEGLIRLVRRFPETGGA